MGLGNFAEGQYLSLGELGTTVENAALKGSGIATASTVAFVPTMPRT